MITKEPHPDYGLPNEFRRKVLAASELVGVHYAAAMFKVSKSSVYNWKKRIAK